MIQKSQTKDERFIIKAYETAVATGERDNIIDPYAVGHSIGLHPKAVDTICAQLVRANFIKKKGSDGITVTEQGERLVRSLLGQL